MTKAEQLIEQMVDAPETVDPSAGYSDKEFRERLKNLINSESMENGSDTPDHILADYLIRCLVNFDTAVNARREWHR